VKPTQQASHLVVLIPDADRLTERTVMYKQMNTKTNTSHITALDWEGREG
jgi:hypothetical protein